MTVVVFTLVGVGVYLVACLIWPTAPCLRCGGRGNHRSIGWPFLIAGVVVFVIAAQTEVTWLALAAVVLALAGFLIRGGASRRCGRCGGSGRRRRLGARLIGRAQ